MNLACFGKLPYVWHQGDPPAFEVTEVGVIPTYYWTRIGPDGFPTEPINAHGPYWFQCTAYRKGHEATGGLGVAG